MLEDGREDKERRGVDSVCVRERREREREK